MANERKIDMVILGLLNHEPLTGYDIKKHIDNAISFFWKGSFGSIYPALDDMVKKNLIIKSELDAGKRKKIYYSITSEGKLFLKNWLKESNVKNELKYETLLKLYFGNAVDKNTNIQNIEIFEENIKEQLEILKIYSNNLSKVLDEEDHLYYYLTVSFGVETYEGYLKWCEKAKKLLKKTHTKNKK